MFYSPDKQSKTMSYKDEQDLDAATQALIEQLINQNKKEQTGNTAANKDNGNNIFQCKHGKSMMSLSAL